MTQHSSPTDPDGETQHPSPTTGAELQQATPIDKAGSRWTRISVELLDGGDALIYIVVGICFFVGSLFALGYSFWNFYSLIVTNKQTPSNTGQAIIQFISDLLLVLIIMEV